MTDDGKAGDGIKVLGIGIESQKLHRDFLNKKFGKVEVALFDFYFFEFQSCRRRNEGSLISLLMIGAAEV